MYSKPDKRTDLPKWARVSIRLRPGTYTVQPRFMVAATPGVVGISRWLVPKLINLQVRNKPISFHIFAFGDMRHKTTILMITRGRTREISRCRKLRSYFKYVEVPSKVLAPEHREAPGQRSHRHCVAGIRFLGQVRCISNRITLLSHP